MKEYFKTDEKASEGTSKKTTKAGTYELKNVKSKISTADSFQIFSSESTVILSDKGKTIGIIANITISFIVLDEENDNSP